MTNEGERVWFITGASKGFGRGLAEHALRAGHRVVGMARTTTALESLHAEFPETFVGMTVDARDLQASAEAVTAAERRFGRIDVLVNNAGRGLFGAVEETDPNVLLDLFQLNVIAPCHLIRSALPFLRKSERPRIVNVSSAVGHATMPFAGMYSATKHALEAISEALAGELAAERIPVVIVEPGYFATEFATSMEWLPALPAYAETRAAVASQWQAMKPGEPAAVVEAIWRAVASPKPPRRLPVGADAGPWIRQSLEARLAEVEAAIQAGAM